MENFFDKYELYTDDESIYCYPNTFVLKNKLNIKDFDTLKKAEGDFVSARLFELENKSMQGAFDKKHLYEIHEYLFQDLYVFAGKTRKEDISKGDTKFCVHYYIESQLKDVFEKIKKRKPNLESSREDIIDFLAFVMSELNIIHPFREGNGRAIREFVREFALRLNMTIQWSMVEKEELLDAMIESVYDKRAIALKKCLSQLLI